MKFRLTKSMGLTPAIPASATTPNAQAVKVPPPAQIQAICPNKYLQYRVIQNLYEKPSKL